MKPGLIFIIPVFIIALIRIINPYSGHLVQIRNYPEQSEFQDSSMQKNTRYLYLGAEKCASVCHNNDSMGFQYNSWIKSPHSDAYKILDSKKAEKYAREANVIENPQESQACQKCHITASGLDSTYFAATYNKEDGVTCEACHKHNYNGKTYIPAEADCLICHNDSLHKVHKFNFREESLKIEHKRPVRL
jgi:hypothetical protein